MDSPRGGGGRSARAEFVACSSCYCSASLSIHFGYELWLEEVSDSPLQRRGQSACSPWTVRFSGFATGGSVSFNGQSAAQGWTVRGTGADSPRQEAGQSTWPVQTVRPSWPDGPPEPGCFVPWFDSSLLLSCF
jgi:hypothetical protein